jgi:hypothetical protein
MTLRFDIEAKKALEARNRFGPLFLICSNQGVTIDFVGKSHAPD